MTLHPSHQLAPYSHSSCSGSVQDEPTVGAEAGQAASATSSPASQAKPQPAAASSGASSLASATASDPVEEVASAGPSARVVEPPQWASMARPPAAAKAERVGKDACSLTATITDGRPLPDPSGRQGIARGCPSSCSSESAPATASRTQSTYRMSTWIERERLGVNTQSDAIAS